MADKTESCTLLHCSTYALTFSRAVLVCLANQRTLRYTQVRPESLRCIEVASLYGGFSLSNFVA